ncbi:MAG TPA: hypothetical protein H9884_06955 [Candidatus Yaniella excrementigallinarum]|nr:hypothetical protein [Candidatus Yaniella excrementigallinarum]
MTENDAEFYSGSEEPDLEEPEDGRESYPPVEGSSDEPETLDAQDPLRGTEGVLSDTEGPTTLTGQETEPLLDDDWAIAEENVVDETELEEELDEDLE